MAQLQRKPQPRRAGRPVRRALADGRSLRDAIWRTLRDRKPLTVRAAAEMACCHESSARTYLESLVESGHVQRLVAGAAVTYVLTRDAGETTPRVRRDGTSLSHRTGRAAAWRALPAMGTFTARDLHLFCGIGEVDAKYYCGKLVEGGYLTVVAKGKGGGEASRYRYIESKYSGPLAPQVTKIKCVWDPNIGAIVWPLNGEDEA
ncbi:MAG TPA: hypothetical protein VLA00_14735 [Xanthobacteraceae bacterium]|nr:hypothetical protein [Xanthobacteraceae bacterium]